MPLVRPQNALTIGRIQYAQHLVLLAVNINHGIGVGDLAQRLLRGLGEAAHAALNDAAMAVLVQHALEHLLVAAIKLVLAVGAQELHFRLAGDVLEVVVFGDEAAAQVQGTDEAQRALAGAAAADEDERGVRAEEALIRRRRRGGRRDVFDGHFDVSGTFRWWMVGRFGACWLSAGRPGPSTSTSFGKDSGETVWWCGWSPAALLGLLGVTNRRQSAGVSRSIYREGHEPAAPRCRLDE